MSLFTDYKFANLISNQLDNFAWKSKTMAEFRCPLCGDSKKKKAKRRGNFYEWKGDLMMKCHNCGAVMGIGHFIKLISPKLYEEYVSDNFINNVTHKWKTTSREKTLEEKEALIKAAPEPFGKKDTGKIIVKGAEPISNLPLDHPAKKYLTDRKIPVKHLDDLYYTPNFMLWVHENIRSDKFKKEVIPKVDPRIIIPFRGPSGKIVGYQGRTISDNSFLRYITIKEPSEENSPLIFGSERCDWTKTVYVFEGPFDSLFVDNAIAAAGSSLKKLLKFKKVDKVFCFDNEPRAKDIINLMEEILDEGEKLLIWPESFSEKDVNKMVTSKEIEIEEINKLIDSRTFSGLIGKLTFNKWKKI